MKRERQDLILQSRSQSLPTDSTDQDHVAVSDQPKHHDLVENVICSLDSIRIDRKLFNCQCTRKCMTRACACKLGGENCDSNCHTDNHKCVNK